MGANDKLVKKAIKALETYTCRKKLPSGLVAYLKGEYGEDPWPYEYSEQDLYAAISRDVMRFFAGGLDVTPKTPEVSLWEGNERLRDPCVEQGQGCGHVGE